MATVQDGELEGAQESVFRTAGTNVALNISKPSEMSYMASQPPQVTLSWEDPPGLQSQLLRTRTPRRPRLYLRLPGRHPAAKGSLALQGRVPTSWTKSRTLPPRCFLWKLLTPPASRSTHLHHVLRKQDCFSQQERRISSL